jgi:hypothetical protein
MGTCSRNMVKPRDPVRDNAEIAGALNRIDEALALAGETAEHWSDAFLDRCRGEVRLRRDLANTAPVEDAFLTVLTIAQQQKARSFELCAALDLARIYSTPVSPTPMPCSPAALFDPDQATAADIYPLVARRFRNSQLCGSPRFLGSIAPARSMARNALLHDRAPLNRCHRKKVPDFAEHYLA